jgi:hypothetical protein
MFMKQKLWKVYHVATAFGLDPIKTISTLKALPWYFRDLSELKRQQQTSKAPFSLCNSYPYLQDKFAEGGTAKGHYFHQDLLVARRIFENNPKIHVDIGSRVDGFVAHVASFREIVVFDIRPLDNRIPNIKFKAADLMTEIGDELVDFCDSLSCLHALEHFGLGRYGDPINHDGYLDGLNNIYKILKAGGRFYLSVPIGPQRLEFNGQRVFSLGYLLSLLQNRYQIDHFSLVDNKGDLHENVELTPEEIESNFGCRYGLGIFEMTKL